MELLLLASSPITGQEPDANRLFGVPGRNWFGEKRRVCLLGAIMFSLSLQYSQRHSKRIYTLPNASNGF